MRRFIFLALLLAGCSSGGGGSTTTATCGPGSDATWSQPTLSGWVQMWGDCLSAPNFTFPADSSENGGVHYLAEPPPSGIVYGQTMTLTFTIAGDGVMSANDTSEGPPMSLSLYMDRRGDQANTGAYNYYRLFCGHGTKDFTDASGNVIPGTYTLSCPLNESNWTGVGFSGYPPNPTQAQFQQTLSNLYAVGFTCGGEYFAGHGCYAKSGTVTFTLNSFTVQ